MSILTILNSILIAILFFFNPQQSQYGAVVNSSPALFETSLASAIGASDTSLTLVSGKTRDGTNLTGNTCLTIDSGLPTTEYVCGTASSSSVTGLTRGIGSDGFTSYTALKFSHRYGADVKITDFPYLQQHGAFLNGSATLPNPLVYTSGAPSFITSSSQLASKGYVDSVSGTGAAPISTTVAGIGMLSTQAQMSAGTATSSYLAQIYSLIPQNQYFGSTQSSRIMTPVTNSSGKLAQGFLDLTQSFTFSGNLTNTATTTVNNLTATSSTFINSPTIPLTPMNTTDAASKSYVDSYAMKYTLVQNTSSSTSATSSIIRTITLPAMGVNDTAVFDFEANLAVSGAVVNTIALKQGDTTLSSITTNTSARYFPLVKMRMRNSTSSEYFNATWVNNQSTSATTTQGTSSVDFSTPKSIDLYLSTDYGFGSVTLNSDYFDVYIIKGQ